MLSALALNLAFFFPMVFGVLVLLFWVPLAVDRRFTFGKGFVWGLGVFGPHFVWLAVLLVTKSHAPYALALLGYAGVVAYFAVTSGVWLALTGRLPVRWWVRVITAVFYYYYIENYSLIIFGRCEGYPFLNPLIPLAEYPWVVWLVAKVGAALRWVMFGGALTLNPLAPGDVRLVYVAPMPGVQEHAVKVGQQVFHALAKLSLGSVESSVDQARVTKPLIIVTPESFYQFSLNLRPEQLSLWSSVVPDGAFFVVGSQMIIGRKFYQAAYLTQGGLIKKYYVKHHCTPFVEKIPKLWRRIEPLRGVFLQNADEFSRGKMPLAQGLFDVGAGVRLIPQICSEFFFTLSAPKVWQVCQLCGDYKRALLLMINDSWFAGYFQQTLKALTAIKAAYLGLPVIYVGHNGCKWYVSYDSN